MIWFRYSMTIEGIHLDQWQAQKVFYEARRIAREEGRLQRWPAIVLAIGLALPITCAYWPLFAFHLLPMWPAPGNIVSGMMLGLIVGVAAALIAGPASNLSFRLLHHCDIRRAMGLAGYPMCWQCGYSHQGLPDSVEQCPECGAQREPMTEAKA